MKSLFLIPIYLFAIGCLNVINAQTKYSVKGAIEITKLGNDNISLFSVGDKTDVVYFLGTKSRDNGIIHIPLAKGKTATIEELHKLVKLTKNGNDKSIIKETDIDKIEVFKSGSSSSLSLFCKFINLSKGKQYYTGFSISQNTLLNALEYFGVKPENTNYKIYEGAFVIY